MRAWRPNSTSECGVSPSPSSFFSFLEWTAAEVWRCLFRFRCFSKSFSEAGMEQKDHSRKMQKKLPCCRWHQQVLQPFWQLQAGFCILWGPKGWGNTSLQALSPLPCSHQRITNSYWFKQLLLGCWTQNTSQQSALQSLPSLTFSQVLEVGWWVELRAVTLWRASTLQTHRRERVKPPDENRGTLSSAMKSFGMTATPNLPSRSWIHRPLEILQENISFMRVINHTCKCLWVGRNVESDVLCSSAPFTASCALPKKGANTL